MEAIIILDNESDKWPTFTGLKEAANYKNTDFKIFGKPTSRMYRRMGITLSHGTEDCSELVLKAKKWLEKLKLINSSLPNLHVVL